MLPGLCFRVLIFIQIFCILSFIAHLCDATVKSIVNKSDPDESLNVTELIRSKGYPYEEHRVLTKDGYILGLVRIPYGQKSSERGRPVLLQHGLLDSSETWVINFPNQSLGFILADAGYDVWLGNMRGNRYSRMHVKYNPDHDEAFWDFSWDDMARDDLPSMIYYILNITQQSHIAYVGHSQGTLIAFAQFGHPNSVVAQNVSFYASLAPIAQIGHQKTPLRYLYTDSKELERYWHQLFGRNEFLPKSNILKWLSRYVCADVIIDRAICENILFIVGGPDTKNFNQTRIPVYTSHIPAGTSVKNMVHFMQCGRSNRFQAYNYETADENCAHYNQTTPPLYSIRDMKIPTAVFWGGEDWLADPEDVTYVFDNIPNLVYEKYLSNYEHFDFVWAETVNTIIYDELLQVMKAYHPVH